jgi:hypothetical protein
VRDLAPAAVRSLAEAPGGNAFADTVGLTNIPASGAANVFTQEYPAGNYVFIVNLRVVSVSAQDALVDCSLRPAGGRQLAEEFVTLRSGGTVMITFVGWTTLEAANTMIVSCSDVTGIGYQVDDGQVVGFQVAAINP